MKGFLFVHPRQQNQANPPSAPADSGATLQARGHTHIDVLGRRVLQGDVEIKDDRFSFAGALHLLPPESPLQINAAVAGSIGKEHFEFHGEARTVLLGMTLSGAVIHATGNRFYLEGTWLDQTLALDVRAEGKNLVLYGGMPKALKIGSVFALSDAMNREAGPSVHLAGPDILFFRLSGRIAFLGFEQATELKYENGLYEVKIDGSLFGILTCSARAYGGSLSILNDFSFEIIATSKFAQFEQSALDYINLQVEHAPGEIGKAEKAVADAQAEYNRALNAEIEKQRQIAEGRKQAALGGLNAVQQELRKKDQELFALDEQINRRRQEVEAGRRANRRKFDDARAVLTVAQEEVRKIQAEIDQHNAWFHSLPDSDLRLWVPCQTKMAVAYGAKWLVLSGAKEVADFGLERAKEAVSALQWVIELPPVDLDPEITAMLGVQTLGLAVLGEIRTGFKDAENLVAALPADLLSPERLFLEAAKIVTNEPLNRTRELLNTTQAAFSGILAIGKWIENHGGLLPLEILRARFAGQFSRVSGRVLLCDATIVYTATTGQRQQMEVVFDMDFDDISGTAVGLVKRLVGV